MHLIPPSPAEAKDLSALDAHELLRERFLHPLLRHQVDTSGDLLARIAAGSELRVSFEVQSRAFTVDLIDATRSTIAAGSLPRDPQTQDLITAVATALVSALNAESEDRRDALADAVVDEGLLVIATLRVLAGTEVFGLRLERQGQTIWRVDRAAVFPDSERLGRPRLH